MSISGRLASILTRGKIANARVNGRTLLQVTGLDKETFDTVELLLPPGYSFRPKASNRADVVILDLGAYASHKIALGGDDMTDAVKDLQPGEGGLSSGGQRIILRVGRTEIISALLQWAATPSGPLQRLVHEEFLALFNMHTHGGGPVPDQHMTAAQLTGGS